MWKLHFNTHWKHKTPQLQSQVVCYFFFHFCCNQQRFICNVFANLEELKGMNRNKRKFDENISLTWSIWQDEMTKTKKKKKIHCKRVFTTKIEMNEVPISCVFLQFSCTYSRTSSKNDYFTVFLRILSIVFCSTIFQFLSRNSFCCCTQTLHSKGK